MHVLHLIDAAGPQASPTTLALMAESLGRLDSIDQQVLILGPTAMQRTGRDVGLGEADHLGVPFGRAMLALPGVRRKMLSSYGGWRAFDLIHCWSVGALSLAALMCRNVPRALTITVMPPKRVVHWLRIICHETVSSGSPTVLLAISNTIRGQLLSGGVKESAVQVLRPALDMARVARTTRAALRESWGVETEEEKVIALLSDPPTSANAVAATMAISIASDSRVGNTMPLRLLVHRDQLNRYRSQKVMRDLGFPKRVIADALLDRPWLALPGCDLALVQGPHAGGLSLLWAMAANVPIVGEATYAISERVEDRHSALLAKPNDPKLISKRIGQLIDDPHLAWQLRDAARSEAYSLFSRHHYCQSLESMYRKVVGW